MLASAVVALGSLVSLTTKPLAALDKRYVDTDGDLVADTPAKTVNPAILVFAYTPGEDRALHASVWDGLLRHLEKMTGKQLTFFPVQSNAAELEAMRAGRLHIAAFGTGSVPIAVNCAGFVPLCNHGRRAWHPGLRNGDHYLS
jgi:phosphonate transport system substrate-binding protein